MNFSNQVLAEGASRSLGLQVLDRDLDSRARITQIMNLTSLAPDIQEEILSLPRTATGRDPIREQNLRPVARCYFWDKQRMIWAALKT